MNLDGHILNKFYDEITSPSVQNVLILEDSEYRQKVFSEIYKDAENLYMTDTIEALAHQLYYEDWDCLMLDYDLSLNQDTEKNGFDAIVWLCDNVDRCPKLVIAHSEISTKAVEMLDILGDYVSDDNVLIQIPFSVIDKTYKKMFRRIAELEEKKFT